MANENLKKYYRAGLWPMHPEDPKATKRFEASKRVFKTLLNQHPFLKNIGDEVDIIDVAAGTGIGGAALTKTLEAIGKKAKLLVSDVRGEDLPKVKSWLGREAEALVASATQLHEKLGDRKFDVALLWGLSAVHFDPWEMSKALASISTVLRDNGVFMLEEYDRCYKVFYLTGYKNLLEEGRSGAERIVSIHTGYNQEKGEFIRTFYTLPSHKEIARVGYHFWCLADIAAMTWMFFKDVDIIDPAEHGVEQINHIVLAKNPRKTLTPQQLITPRILKRKGEDR